MPKLLPFPSVKPSAWPPAFRRLHVLRKRPTGPLDKPSVAATWRPTTFDLHVWSVGYFVGWLQWSQRFGDNAELQEYVTPEIVGAYADCMRTFGLSPRTMATRLDGVRAALAALSPTVDTAWLMGGINMLRAEPSDRRCVHERSRHTHDIVEAGMSLMRQAIRGSSNHSALERAILYRDGLLLVFMALVVPRLNTVHIMALGKHLIRHDEIFKIAWSAKEMKENRCYEAQLDLELSDLIHRYLGEFRPVLLARAERFGKKAGTAVWLGRDSQKLGSNAIYRIIIRRTEAAFGKSIFPHAFRHSAATSLALDRPDLIKLATPLLQHSVEASRELYVLADKVEASRRFGDALNTRRTATPQGRRLMRRLSRRSERGRAPEPFEQGKQVR